MMGIVHPVSWREEETVDELHTERQLTGEGEPATTDHASPNGDGVSLPERLARATEAASEPPTLTPTGELARLRELVDREPVVLVIPSEVFIQFYPAGPEQVINALHAAGFDQIYFESLGDELVALAYLRMWRDNVEKRTWIRSTNPLVVEYCRAKHPELLPYLAPIVPPALALAR